MPSDEWPQSNDKLEKNLQIQDLEAQIEVQVEPYSHVADIIELAKNNKTVSFVLDPNYNLLLSSDIHEVFTKRLGIIRQECLVWDGDVFLDVDKKIINFVYTHRSDKYVNNKNLHSVCEDKITQFFTKKGLDLKGFRMVKRK